MSNVSEEVLKTVLGELDELAAIKDIHEMLLEQVKPIEVAKFIRFTLRRMEHRNVETIRDALKQRLEDLLSDSGKTAAMAKIGRSELESVSRPGIVHKYAKTLYDRLAISIDPMVENAALYLAVRDLIAVKLGDDQIDPNIYRDFEEARRLLETHVDFMDKFGAIRDRSVRESPGAEVPARRQYGEGIAKVLATPKSRHKVLAALRAIVDAKALPPGPEETN